MTTRERRAPGIPTDYYRRIHQFEERHFWYRGMRQITGSLLGDRLARPGTRLLDAGCGTGGFLRWALDTGTFESAAGIDLGTEAIELARLRVPEADLRVGSLRSLPFPDQSFDLVVTNDVLQHVPETDVGSSLGELNRVLAAGGTLLVHTNGSRHLRRERDDWRAYDRETLVSELLRAGFACERVTHANAVLSLWAVFRGRRPQAPTDSTDGIPQRQPSPVVSCLGARLLAAEATWLSRPKRTLPYGHTLFAVARKAGPGEVR